jgi:hypothetical protein
MLDLIIPVLVTLFLASQFVFARAITVLFHELGHAIPALIFTKEKVNVFIGTYGDVKKSRHLALGKKLSIYFKLNPLKWSKGMAQYTGHNLSLFKRLTIMSLGSLNSLFLALIAIFIIYSFNLYAF